VKPANILLNRYGQVALSDFGLATMPASGPDASVTRESLTPSYAPPEAFDLAEPSPAGDVYALAATLYALLSGRPPRFPESGVPNLAMILALHRLPVPDIPGVPPALTAVLRQALASDPRARIPTAAALRDALTAVPLTATGAGAPNAYPPSLPAQPVPPMSVPAHTGEPMPRHTGEPLPRHTGEPLPRHTGEPPSRHTGEPPSRHTGEPPSRHARGAHSRHSGQATAPPAYPAGSQGDTRPPASRGASKALISIVAALALVVAGGVGVMVYTYVTRTPDTRQATPGASGSPGGTSSSPVAKPSREAKVFAGLDTYTEGCAAAKVRGAGAACVRDAECWGGLVIIAGDTKARRSGCEETHSWETFAVGPIPSDADTYVQQDLAKHPTVKKVCSRAALLASRVGAARSIGAARWTADVMPPSQAQYDDGVRFYRCVGTLTGQESRRSFFH
jgi:hypothetical protein